MNPILQTPNEPVRVALIGTGNRARTVYRPLFKALQPWISLVAVCDPVKENCDAMAQALSVPAFYDIRELAKARPMEAAIAVTPIESHHSISVYLSSCGIHNLTETPWASMLSQAQEMFAVARRHNVVARVGENFFRFPIDRFAQTVQRSGYLGHIGRIFSYCDSTSYHNDSRWTVFAGSRPNWAQCVQHAMSHPPFYFMPERRLETEALGARFFGFPNGFLVVDVGAGHVKGHLGRHPRPGYTEWHGERGTLVHRATGATSGNVQTELRRCSESKFAAHQEQAGKRSGGGIADEVTPVITETRDGIWTRIYAETPSERIEYLNPFATPDVTQHLCEPQEVSFTVMSHIVDFALAVRGLRASEFNDEDAVMSQMMEVAVRESALNDGKRISLPMQGAAETDALTGANLKKRYGVDPLDVEAMLQISFPRT